MKKTVYLNTAPKANTREDGTKFFTVLVGVVDSLLKEKTGKTKAEVPALTLTMEVFPEKVEAFTEAFNACKKKGYKLVLLADDVTITEMKPNNYVKDGVLVNGLQASCWGTGETQLTVQSSKFSISVELAKIMGHLDEIEDI